MKVRGGYHQVGIFFSQLANMPRIVNVSDLVLNEFKKKKQNKKDGEGSSAKKFHTVEAEFTLSAYTLQGGIADEEIQVD